MSLPTRRGSPGHGRGSFRRRCRACTFWVLLGSVPAMGCNAVGLGFPATPPGVISPDRRAPRQVGLEVQGRWQTLVEGGVALSVEPQIARRTSLPITVSGGWWSGLQSRFAVRHRAYRGLTLGGGVGVNAWYHWQESPSWLRPPYIAGVFDLEVGVAGRLGWFGTTLALRPCLGVYHRRLSEGTGIFGFLEVRHAWLFFLSRSTAITLRFELGVGNDPAEDTLAMPSSPFAGDTLIFFGVSVGVMVVLQ